MIQGLLILNSAFVGSRDLFWVDDPKAEKGYNIYRSYDNAKNWIRLNDAPWSGHFYRDETTLEVVTMDVTDDDWVERGEFGKYGVKLADEPFSSIVRGRAQVANSVDDVTVMVDEVAYRPAMVVGMDKTVWIRIDKTLPTGGAVSSFPIADIANATKVQIIYKKLRNFVDIYSNLTRTFYTVVGLDKDIHEIHAPGAPGTDIVDSMQIDKMDFMQAEMVRRNAWLFEQVGEPAWLMFRKTRGEICGCKESGINQPRHGCPVCFETGIVGGYYGPFDILYIDPDVAATRELDEGGVKVTRESRSYLGPTPILQDGDLIVRRNGDRLVVHGVVYKSPRGVILQQDFTTELLRTGDTRYLIPVSPTRNIYNPVTQVDPAADEPVFQAENKPEDKNWENDDKQTGRTVTFGRIQT